MFKDYQRKWGKPDNDATREYQRNYHRKWRAANKGSITQSNRTHFLKAQYGITQEDFDQILSAQDGECAMCHRTPPFGHIKNLCVDHNHDTGNVRGLLCPRCNSLLGAIGDDINWLLNAANYLNIHDDLGFEDFKMKSKPKANGQS